MVAAVERPAGLHRRHIDHRPHAAPPRKREHISRREHDAVRRLHGMRHHHARLRDGRTVHDGVHRARDTIERPRLCEVVRDEELRRLRQHAPRFRRIAHDRYDLRPRLCREHMMHELRAHIAARACHEIPHPAPPFAFHFTRAAPAPYRAPAARHRPYRSNDTPRAAR